MKLITLLFVVSLYIGDQATLFANTQTPTTALKTTTESDSSKLELKIVYKRSRKQKKTIRPGKGITIWSGENKMKFKGILTRVSQDSIQVNDRCFALKDIWAISPKKNYQLLNIPLKILGGAGIGWTIFIIGVWSSSSDFGSIFFPMVLVGGLLILLGFSSPGKFNTRRFDFIASQSEK